MIDGQPEKKIKFKLNFGRVKKEIFSVAVDAKFLRATGMTNEQIVRGALAEALLPAGWSNDLGEFQGKHLAAAQVVRVVVEVDL